MKTLLEQIRDIKDEISKRQRDIDYYKELLNKLEDSRVYCEHEWDSGVKGFEHEGVYCKKCGINDQYATTLKRMLGVDNHSR